MSIKQLLARILNVLNGSSVGVSQTYQPVTGLTISNLVFNYHRIGRLLIINGRFNVTAINTSQNAFLTFNLPSGMTAQNMGVGSCGTVTYNTGDDAGLSIRCDGGSTFYIQYGAGGYSVPKMRTGYYMINATLILSGGGRISPVFSRLFAILRGWRYEHKGLTYSNNKSHPTDRDDVRSKLDSIVVNVWHSVNGLPHTTKRQIYFSGERASRNRIVGGRHIRSLLLDAINWVWQHFNVVRSVISYHVKCLFSNICDSKLFILGIRQTTGYSYNLTLGRGCSYEY